MTEIVPRWEWRTFGANLPDEHATFEEISHTGVFDSDEVYLLSPGGSNVKIRDDLMDIKVLREVDAAGLEQWMPVTKTAFPITRPGLEEVFKALGIAPPDLHRDRYTLTQFIEEIALRHPDVQVVDVHKRRSRYVVGGCSMESTDVVANGRRTRTIAVESEDAAAVVDGVSSLGLSDYLNINYIKGLRGAIEGTPSRYGVIDVGTNSVKFHLAELDEAGSWTTMVDRAELTRLGEDLDTSGEITPSAIERTATAIAAMADEAKQHDALAIAAVGTAGLRIAQNRDDVIEQIRSLSGVTVEVISGDEESRLAYLAVGQSLDIGEGSLVVFDTGGGSSQFTFGTDNAVDERFSVDVGAVRYTERFHLDEVVPDDLFTDAMAAIAGDLERIHGREAPDRLVAMGGATTNIAAVSHAMMSYDPDVIQGTVLTLAEVDRQIDMYRSMGAAERSGIVGLQPKRADVILAGVCIVRTVMETLDQDSLTVCDRGLRHGLLAERFGASEPLAP
ncbi:MAG: Ppx/GppA phosphatase family protein [Actinomycetota bacterium]